MLITRLIYLAALISSGVFVIMYMDSASLLMFLVLLALPVLLFLLLLIARVSTRIKVSVETTVATVGEPVALKFNVRNASFVALPDVRVKLRYSGGFAEFSEKNELTFPLGAFQNKTVTCDINSEHVGVVKLWVGDIVLQDYFRLFSFKIKVRKTYAISFMPALRPAELELRTNVLMNDDSDVFSKTKKGDDPSEVFAIRDYVGGDKLNRIHWKLSTKQDTLMVKDYSLPINNKVVLLLELGAPAGARQMHRIDTVLETVFSLSHFLCEAEILHNICWYDAGNDRYFNEEVKTLDDLYAALGMVLASKPGAGTDSFAYWSRNRESCSHLVYVSAFAVDTVAPQFTEISYATLYTLFQVCEDPDEPLADAPRGVQLMPVVCDHVADALAGIAL